MSQHEQKIPLIKYWPVATVTVALIASYVTLQNQQASADIRLEKVENKQVAIDTVNTQILVQLGQMQNDLQWIKMKLK